MKEQDLINRVLKGHVGAIRFFNMVVSISQVLDDLVDGDKPVTREQIQSAFWDALVQLPMNPFYQDNLARLNAVMAIVLMDWFAANELEQSSDEHDQHIAFITRDNLVQLLFECARIVGGAAWLLQHAVAMRRFVHDESFNTYVEAL